MTNNELAKKACIYTRPLFINVYTEKGKTITKIQFLKSFS